MVQSDIGQGGGATDTEAADVERVRSFWRNVARHPAGASLEWDDRKSRVIVLVSGWLAEMRILPDGRRQVFSFLVPGDVTIPGRRTNVGACGLVALTPVEIADFAALACGEQAETLSQSMRAAVRQREERLGDEIVRIGLLTAKERLLNLLLELHDRLDAVGLARDGHFRCPITQEMFADALGLSVVHINRTAQQLRQEGTVTFGRGTVTLHQPRKLSAAACHRED
jgi:CRP-like cAMP-binding protein